MKKIKNFLKAIVLILPIMILISNCSYATESATGIYFALYGKGSGRKTQFYYVLTDGASVNPNKPVIKIVKSNEAGTVETADTNTSMIYCIKNGVGFGAAGSSSQPNSSVLYNQYFDLRQPSSIDSTYKAALPQNETRYKQLMWVLDNICNPLDANSKKTLLENAGLSENEFQNYTIGSYSKTDIEKDIIEVIQQAAIWYFTNQEGGTNVTEYHPSYDANFRWDNSYTSNPSHSLSDFNPDASIVTDEDPIMILYHYLIDNAVQAVENEYTYSSNAETSPITFDKERATVELNGSNYLIGPYKVSKTGTKAYTLTASIKNGTTEISNVTLLGENKTTVLTGSTTVDKIKSNLGKDFYISIPISTNISQVKIDLSTTYASKDITYWSTPASVANSNQPVVIIETKNKTDSASDTKSITQPKFDLALRKFIIKIGNTELKNNGKYTREPQIGEWSLDKTQGQNTGTTLTKQHDKTALEVSKGDKVTYIIRIYNEGEIAGKATQVTDYLPEGLELVPASESTTNTTYGWTPDASNSRIVRTTKLQNTTIDPYNSSTNTLDYEDLQIECKVTANYGTTDKVLKNVAEITGASNEVGIEDRDSKPNNVEKTGSDYSVSTSTQGKGYQDDDDFEDLVLPGKHFDLALRKFITSKNGKALTESRTPNITQEELNKLANGSATYDNGNTAKKEHPKKPIQVESGDKIVYEIKIYNEGEIDGYAEIITDYLPEGLNLVSDSTINQQYGWVQNGNKVTTDYLSKAKNSSDNLIKALKYNSTTQLYTLDSKSVFIECYVLEQDNSEVINLKNVAEITNAWNEDGIDDRDSEPNNVEKTGNDYSVSTSTHGKGYQDDDDFEHLILQPKYFDLALRKFITKINDNDVTESREPQSTLDDLKKLAEGTAPLDGTTATKQHTKTPVPVYTGDKVTYTIRIYNEGKIAGKATQVTDYLPEGLELVPASESTINTEYLWTPDDSNSRIVRTSYLQNTSIDAFNSTTNKLDCEDLQIECKVVANNSNTDISLKNVVEITEARNVEGEIVEDRDSEPNNVEKTGNDYSVSTSTQGKGYEDDDDYEELLLKGKYFDLALRKYITAVNGVAPNISRQPNSTTEELTKFAAGDSELDNGTTVTKQHTKTPLSVSTGDKITYTIRIYNEGQVDGYATIITDYLPEGLELVPVSESTINTKYKWVANNENNKIISTEYLKYNKINAFNASSKILSSDYVEVECRVTATTVTANNLKNIAEITESKNDFNLPDRDSPNKLTDNQKKTYNPSESEKGKGFEDDDDYEDLKLVKFDLALRKFITGVNDEAITDRIPQVDKSKFGTTVNGKEVTTCTYTHSKEPVAVKTNDTVIYTLRIYNEGNINGYASEIKDDLPEGLEFLPNHQINQEYRWTMYDKDGNITTEIKNAKYIKTDYLSKAQGEARISSSSNGENPNLIKAFNKDTMNSPDFKDVKIAFKVTEPNTSDRIIINQAQIAKNTDPDGNEVKDIDSTPDEWKNEDDEDIEKIYVKYFDLSLRKWVTQAIVIEDGVQKEMDTNHYAEQDPEPIVKVNLNKKRLENTVVKFRYSIRVKNEGEIEGYATEISDYIPDGLKFNQADNPEWKEANGKITTDALKDTLLKPGETAEVKVVLTWINSESNMGVKTNIAEISADKNEYDTPDIDSTPNNKKEGEDDIDDAPVALTVVTGSAPTYIALITGTLIILTAGIVVIKKYVV